MNTKVIFLATAIVLLLCSSCNKDSSKLEISFSGKVEKGPYLIGSSVVAHELDENMNQTGKSFTTEITTNDGNFSFTEIEIVSKYLLLSASGYYFSEIYGESSPGPLNLQAIVDVTDKNTLNINLFTNAIKPRVLKLIEDGTDFHEANLQAKSEFIDFLGINEETISDFDQLNIVGEGDLNAALLAYSLICQRWTGFLNERPGLTGELSELSTNISLDFKENGEVNSESLINQLLSNIASLNYQNIRNNIIAKYNTLGISVEIPDFEYYIGLFLLKHDPDNSQDFEYPLTASPNSQIAPDSELNNLLYKDKTQYLANSPNSPHVVAASTPIGNNLIIKIIPQTCNPDGGGSICITNGGLHNGGWEITNDNGTWIFTNQRENSLCSALFDLVGTGSAIVEYYENDISSPSFTKTIYWDY